MTLIIRFNIKVFSKLLSSVIFPPFFVIIVFSTLKKHGGIARKWIIECNKHFFGSRSFIQRFEVFTRAFEQIIDYSTEMFVGFLFDK